MKHPPYTKRGMPDDVIDGELMASRVMAGVRRERAGRKMSASLRDKTRRWADRERTDRLALLDRARQGDPEAVAELYGRFRAWVIR